MSEQFKSPINFPLYKVSNLGYVIGTRGKVLKTEKTNRGYYRVTLCYNGVVKRFSLHRLVASLFCKKLPVHTEVNHKDGNKRNSAASNLEWCTQLENVHHCIATGLQKVKGQDNPTSKLTNKEVKQIKLLKGKLPHRKIAKQYGVSHALIGYILRNQNWSHI